MTNQIKQDLAEILDEPQLSEVLDIISRGDRAKDEANRLAIKKYRKQENKEPLSSLIITIDYSETNDGYMYEIFENETCMNGGDSSLDGGLCTGRLIDALGMAVDQAEGLINNSNN